MTVIRLNPYLTETNIAHVPKVWNKTKIKYVLPVKVDFALYATATHNRKQNHRFEQQPKQNCTNQPIRAQTQILLIQSWNILFDLRPCYWQHTNCKKMQITNVYNPQCEGRVMNRHHQQYFKMKHSKTYLGHLQKNCCISHFIAHIQIFQIKRKFSALYIRNLR